MPRHSALLTACLTTLLACAPRTPAAPAPAPAPAITATTWVARSAEFVSLTTQVFAQATMAVERAATGRPRGSWAIVADADETLISNLTYQLELERDNRSYTPATWKRWTERREATAIPGAPAFLQRVRALGGRIVIVTNRLASECADTRSNLDALGLLYDAVLCRADGGPSDKNPRFASVSAGTWTSPSAPVDVIAWVGDNILDFPGQSQAIRGGGDAAFRDFGTRFFMLPNPMYGSWQ